MRRRRARRWLLALARLASAVVLLAGFWLLAVRVADASSRRIDERRMRERRELASAFAAPIAEWLAAASREAAGLAAVLDRGGGAGALDTYLRSSPRPVFGRSALLLDRRRTAVATSSDQLGALNRVLRPCTVTDETGAAEADRAFDDLLAAAAGSPGGAVSPVLRVPPGCRESVVAVAPARGGTLVLVGDLADAGLRTAAGGAIGRGVRVLLVDPLGAAFSPGEEPGPERPMSPGSPPEPPVPAGGLSGETEPLEPPVREFAASHAGGEPAVARVALGPGEAPELVVAAAGAGAGWTVVVEQDAADFDLGVSARPVLAVAGALAAAFGAVLVLLVALDVRRVRAQRRADLAKHAFLSIVSHELRTPLTVLEGIAQTLAERWDALDEPARRSLVESMGPQSARLERVIERLLTAAHLQAQARGHPRLEPVETEPLLSGLAAASGPSAPLHELTVEVEAGAGAVRAHPDALREALEQLVDNAVQFSPAGGAVALSARRRRRRVEIAVEDEGVGLPAHPETLFGAFTQAEPVLSRVYAEGGVGVGLFIARTLVEQMDGSLRAEPHHGGARFVISLPPA